MVEDDSTGAHAADPVEECDYCGKLQTIAWTTDDDRWDAAMESSGRHYDFLCPSCFVTWHEIATGLRTTWRLVPDPKSSFKRVPLR